MQVQSLSFFLSDPLLMPCAVRHFEDAVGQVEAAKAVVAGVGHYEAHEPLIAKYRPPTSEFLLQHLGELRSHVFVAATVKAGEGFIHGNDVQPFRYRNWLFAMAGQIHLVDNAGEAALPIPTYIRKNIRGATLPEVLFHQVLAFLHRQGLLAGERWEMSPLRKALKAAISLEGLELAGERRDCSMILTDGRILLGAAMGRPVYTRQFKGIEGCKKCDDRVGRPVFHEHLRGVAFLDTGALPSEEWETIGPNTLFQVDTSLNVETFSLD